MAGQRASPEAAGAGASHAPLSASVPLPLPARCLTGK